MKNLSTLFFAAFFCAILATPIFAKPLDLLKAQNKRNNFTLFTINVTTSNGKPVSGRMAESDYVGRSYSAPCSDLMLLTSGSGKGELAPGYYAFGADDFKDYPGPGLTCFKMDFMIAGKFYSTGNIKLSWSQANRAYTDANPKLIPLNIIV